MVTAYSKINTTNFKYASVNGQYILGMAAKTSDANKFINFFSEESDLVSYVDVSKAGFDLPAVEIVFSFSDKSLIQYLGEKSVFVISVGQNTDSQIQSTFNIISSQIDQKVEGKWIARIVGIYDKTGYAKVQKTKVYANNSSEIAKEILHKSLGKQVKSNAVVRSRDHMFWLQSNKSDYQFLHELWLHSYTQDSVWLTAIDFEGQPKMIDVRKQAKTLPKITLTTGSGQESAGIYTILDSFDIINNSSVNNTFGGGYVQSRPSFNMDENRKIDLQKKENVVLSDSNEYNKLSGISKKDSYVIQTSNVHEKYYEAPLNNRSLYSGLKAFQLDVSIEGKFVPVELLEYVMVKDVQPNGQAQEDYSGLYMVGKIAHQICNKKVYTHLTLWRECQNTLAYPSAAEKIKTTHTKIDNFQQKIDTDSKFMTADVYAELMKKYNNMQQQVSNAQMKAEKAISDTAAYKAYKELDKKYRQMKSYITNVYSTTSMILSLTPFMSDIQSKLNSITIDTPLDDIQRTVGEYLSLQRYMYEIDSKVMNEINSSSVHRGYQEAKMEYNKLTSAISILQAQGLIGDLNEYTEYNGEA